MKDIATFVSERFPPNLSMKQKVATLFGPKQVTLESIVDDLKSLQNVKGLELPWIKTFLETNKELISGKTSTVDHSPKK